MSTNEEQPWELYYWASVGEDGRNHMVGRGEFIRLMFELARVNYIDHGVKDGKPPEKDELKSVYTSSVLDFAKKGGNVDFPFFAPPAIKKGDFVLSQTPTIMKYLGKKFGFYPSSEEDEFHGDALMAFLTDFIAEGRLVFHPKNFNLTYFNQIEEAKPYIKWFEDERMPFFMSYLEKVLEFQVKKGKENGFFVGETLTYVDVAAFHVITAAASQFPAAYDIAVSKTPLLGQHRERISKVPNIAAYLASDRRGFFEGNSMM